MQKIEFVSIPLFGIGDTNVGIPAAGIVLGVDVEEGMGTEAVVLHVLANTATMGTRQIDVKYAYPDDIITNDWNFIDMVLVPGGGGVRYAVWCREHSNE